MIIWCMLTQIWNAHTDIIFCHFRPCVALLSHYWFGKLKCQKCKSWNGKNVKKHLDILSFYTCVPIIKIICTPDMTYGSWDMKFNRQNYSEIFWKYQKWEKTLEVSSFYTSVPKIMIISYTVPEMNVIAIYHFWQFLALLPLPPPPTAQKMKMLKKKNALKYHHLTQVNQKLWSYAI